MDKPNLEELESLLGNKLPDLPGWSAVGTDLKNL
jgi:hypothetical protein